MNVGDIMTKSVVTVHMDDSLERIRAIFEESGFHHLIVVDERKVVGVISDRDLLKHLSPFLGVELMERAQDERTLVKKAHQVMRRKPVTVFETTSLEQACELILSSKVTCLPVVARDGSMRGIVTWRDFLPLCFASDCAAA